MVAWFEFEVAEMLDGDNSIEKQVSKMGDSFGELLVGVFDEQSELLMVDGQ